MVRCPKIDANRIHNARIKDLVRDYNNDILYYTKENKREGDDAKRYVNRNQQN